MSVEIDSMVLKRPEQVLNNPTIEEKNTPIVYLDGTLKSKSNVKYAVIGLAFALIATFALIANKKQVI